MILYVLCDSNPRERDVACGLLAFLAFQQLQVSTRTLQVPPTCQSRTQYPWQHTMIQTMSGWSNKSIWDESISLPPTCVLHNNCSHGQTHVCYITTVVMVKHTCAIIENQHQIFSFVLLAWSFPNDLLVYLIWGGMYSWTASSSPHCNRKSLYYCIL